MTFDEIIKKRESCRSYKGEKVSREKLNAIVEAARYSPSASNSQPWRFIIVDEADRAKQLAEYIGDRQKGVNDFAQQVSSFIIVLQTKAKLNARIAEHFGDEFFTEMAMGSIMAYLTLKATDEGLSTCILGWFDEQKIKEMLQIPEEPKIRLIISVGYPTTPEIREKKRKSMEETVSYNQY